MTPFFDLTPYKTASLLSCGLSEEGGSPADLEHVTFKLGIKTTIHPVVL